MAKKKKLSQQQKDKNLIEKLQLEVNSLRTQHDMEYRTIMTAKLILRDGGEKVRTYGGDEATLVEMILQLKKKLSVWEMHEGQIIPEREMNSRLTEIIRWHINPASAMKMPPNIDPNNLRGDDHGHDHTIKIELPPHIH